MQLPMHRSKNPNCYQPRKYYMHKIKASNNGNMQCNNLFSSENINQSSGTGAGNNGRCQVGSFEACNRASALQAAALALEAAGRLHRCPRLLHSLCLRVGLQCRVQSIVCSAPGSRGACPLCRSVGLLHRRLSGSVLGRCFGGRLVPCSSGGPGHGSSRRSLGCSSPCVGRPRCRCLGRGWPGPAGRRGRRCRLGGRRGARSAGGFTLGRLLLQPPLDFLIFPPHLHSLQTILPDLPQLQDRHLVANLRLQLPAGHWRRFKQPRPPWALRALHGMHACFRGGWPGRVGGRQWQRQRCRRAGCSMPQRAAAHTGPAGAHSQCRSHTALTYARRALVGAPLVRLAAAVRRCSNDHQPGAPRPRCCWQGSE